ncbi:MAG: endolytic transglycosylase MltG [Actinomycetota bacterium]
MRKGCLGLIIIVVLALGFASFTFLSYHHATQGSSNGSTVNLTVAQGASLSGLEPQLQHAGVIGSTTDFKLWLRISGSSGKVSSLQQGSYSLRKSMPYADIISTLAKGPSISYEKLTIPEGLTVTETAAKVGSETHIQAADFQAAATVATAQPTILPPGNPSLEGFLYPQTYFVDPHEDAAQLVQEMVAQFQTETASVNWSLAPQKVTPYQVLTIASLIQNEAKVTSDGPNIASVIYNRLAQHVPLGIDATVYYALDLPFTTPLTQSDLAFASPYNTRVEAGVPPTPISSPDLDYINAALHPAQTNYLYYVLGPDCVHNQFFSSYTAFQQAAANQPKC